MKVLCNRLPNAELQLISNIPHHRMPLLYRAADVLLCASKSEGSPNVVKEALACNLPVVSVPVGDVSERLDGVHPSVVVERDPAVIGEALFEILLNRKRSNGREHVCHLALENIARQVINVYRQALNIKDA
jgi:glycosyltransferase involved in cell wall biosynthesis